MYRIDGAAGVVQASEPAFAALGSLPTFPSRSRGRSYSSQRDNAWKFDVPRIKLVANITGAYAQTD